MAAECFPDNMRTHDGCGCDRCPAIQSYLQRGWGILLHVHGLFASCKVSPRAVPGEFSPLVTFATGGKQRLLCDCDLTSCAVAYRSATCWCLILYAQLNDRALPGTEQQLQVEAIRNHDRWVNRRDNCVRGVSASDGNPVQGGRRWRRKSAWVTAGIGDIIAAMHCCVLPAPM